MSETPPHYLPVGLAAVSVDPPAFGAQTVAAAVTKQFALDGQYSPLVSERDQNFRLRTDDGNSYVVKVVSTAEDAITTEFQIGLLRHVQGADGVIAPIVVPTVDGGDSGDIAGNADSHHLRVVSWVAGEPLESREFDTSTAFEFGTALARLDIALEDYTGQGEARPLLWDLQRVGELAGLVDNIDVADVRASVTRAIDDYIVGVEPLTATLPTQVIHGDANPGNVLATDDAIAFIDFGDSIRAPRVFDVAIAASYLRPAGDDPLSLIAPFVSGYQSVAPLEKAELEVLFDLIRARLATTITLLYWRLSARDAADPYRQQTLRQESGAPKFLAQLDALRDSFAAAIL